VTVLDCTRRPRPNAVAAFRDDCVGLIPTACAIGAPRALVGDRRRELGRRAGAHRDALARLRRHVAAIRCRESSGSNQASFFEPGKIRGRRPRQPIGPLN
jgi:hypothetical protein